MTEPTPPLPEGDPTTPVVRIEGPIIKKKARQIETDRLDEPVLLSAGGNTYYLKTGYPPVL